MINILVFASSSLPFSHYFINFHPTLYLFLISLLSKQLVIVVIIIVAIITTIIVIIFIFAYFILNLTSFPIIL